MIILLLCIIAFVLIFGSKALLDVVFWILAIAAVLGFVALVIGGFWYLWDVWGRDANGVYLGVLAGFVFVCCLLDD